MISEKDHLALNLKAFCKREGHDVNDLIPLTYEININSGNVNNQIMSFVNVFKNLESGTVENDYKCPTVHPTHFCGKNIWIFKPSELNRGRGIQLFNTLKAFKKLINQYRIDVAKKSKRKHCTCIVQKYIERPLLLNERKFDIRVWVLVTQSLRVYMFKDGYLRTSG